MGFQNKQKRLKYLSGDFQTDYINQITTANPNSATKVRLDFSSRCPARRTRYTPSKQFIANSLTQGLGFSTTVARCSIKGHIKIKIKKKLHVALKL